MSIFIVEKTVLKSVIMAVKCGVMCSGLQWDYQPDFLEIIEYG